MLSTVTLLAGHCPQLLTALETTNLPIETHEVRVPAPRNPNMCTREIEPKREWSDQRGLGAVVRCNRKESVGGRFAVSGIVEKPESSKSPGSSSRHSRGTSAAGCSIETAS